MRGGMIRQLEQIRQLNFKIDSEPVWIASQFEKLLRELTMACRLPARAAASAMNDRPVSNIREQAIAFATTTRLQVVTTARREIEALRVALTTRLAALDEALAAGAAQSATDPAVEQLCEAAKTALAFTQAQLDDEIQHRQAIVAELAATNEKLTQAASEVERLRVENQRAQVRVQSLEQEQAAARARPVEIVGRVLDEIARALGSLSESSTGTDVLTTLVELFAQQFSRVVLCSVDALGFTVWRSRGFDPPLERKTVLRVATESPLARAADGWHSVSASETIGVLGSPVRYAVALPIVAKGRGTAMLYAENLPDAPVDWDDRLAGKVAEILAHYVKSRLQVKPPVDTFEPPSHPKQRQAKRVKMTDGTTVVLDDSEGTLIDLSSLGAQVLSRRSIRPNSAVRLVLDTHAGGVAATARVVWVIVEQQPTTQSALYRAGVQFTNVQHGDLNGYLEFFDSAIKH